MKNAKKEDQREKKRRTRLCLMNDRRLRGSTVQVHLPIYIWLGYRIISNRYQVYIYY